MAQFQFNPAQYELQRNLERLPRGWYPVVVIDSEITPTSKQDGFKLTLSFQVIDGPAKGRKLMKSYNINNPSAQAVEIAMRELKTLMVCCGIHTAINQTEELYNRPLQIMLTEPKDSDYNDVKGYKDINGNDADKVAAGPAVGATQYAQPAQQQPQYGMQAPAAPQYQQQFQPAPQAAPAYQPQAAPPAPAQAPPAWAAPPQAPAPATPAPAYQQPPTQAAPQAPAWTPQSGPAPAAPAWVGQR